MSKYILPDQSEALRQPNTEPPFTAIESTLNREMIFTDWEVMHELSRSIADRVYTQTNYPKPQSTDFNPFDVAALDSVPKDISVHIDNTDALWGGWADAYKRQIVLKGEHRAFRYPGLESWISRDVNQMDHLYLIGHELNHIRFGNYVRPTLEGRLRRDHLREIHLSKGMRFMDEFLAKATIMNISPTPPQVVVNSMLTYKKESHLRAMFEDFGDKRDGEYRALCERAAKLVFALDGLGIGPHMVGSVLWSEQISRGINPNLTAQDQIRYLLDRLENIVRTNTPSPQESDLDALVEKSLKDKIEMHAQIDQICREEVRAKYKEILVPLQRSQFYFDDNNIICIPNESQFAALRMQNLGFIAFDIRNLGEDDYETGKPTPTQVVLGIKDQVSGRIVESHIQTGELDAGLLKEILLELLETIPQESIHKILEYSSAMQEGEDLLVDLLREKIKEI